MSYVYLSYVDAINVLTEEKKMIFNGNNNIILI